MIVEPPWVLVLRSVLITAEKSRLKAPPTFMPDGLYLTGVDYPPEWGVATPPPPEWLWF